jgi:hypothetical protein
MYPFVPDTFKSHDILYFLKAHELLISIASLEIAITKLEEDLNRLHYQLCHTRNERLLSENNPGCLLPTPSDCQPSTACDFTEEGVSYLHSFNLIFKLHFFYYAVSHCFFVTFLSMYQC